MSSLIAALECRISAAIDLMPSEFDTHQFILKLAQENQRAYIQALNDSDSDTPFQAVHSLIGKALKRYSLEAATNLREAEVNSRSPNIFGENSSCSRWERFK